MLKIVPTRCWTLLAVVCMRLRPPPPRAALSNTVDAAAVIHGAMLIQRCKQRSADAELSAGGSSSDGSAADVLCNAAQVLANVLSVRTLLSVARTASIAFHQGLSTSFFFYRGDLPRSSFQYSESLRRALTLTSLALPLHIDAAAPVTASGTRVALGRARVAGPVRAGGSVLLHRGRAVRRARC